MKETRMPPAKAANLVANSGNTIYGVGVIDIGKLVLQIMFAGWLVKDVFAFKQSWTCLTVNRLDIFNMLSKDNFLCHDCFRRQCYLVILSATSWLSELEVILLGQSILDW